MKHVEIEHFFKIPQSHPYVSVAAIDPADHRRFIQQIDSQRELKLLGIIDQQPDQWMAYVGCASKRVQADFDSWVDNL